MRLPPRRSLRSRSARQQVNQERRYPAEVTNGRHYCDTLPVTRRQKANADEYRHGDQNQQLCQLGGA
jgi:hypothetical protein